MHRSLFVEFSFLQNVCNMFGDDASLTPKKPRNLLLRHPERFALIANVEPQPLFAIIDQKPVSGFRIFYKMDGFIRCHAPLQGFPEH